MNQAIIQTQQLSRHFKDRIAVDRLDIAIRQGEMFALLGTNGAGKTTTIKMLSCLLPPTSGDASIKGYSIRENPIKIKELIGVSPQETAIASHLSSLENLLLMGGVFGLSRSQSRQKAGELMELLEIEDRKEQARKLSGGLKRRLSIAMALMSDPEILFLDEPTLGLDPHSRRSVWTYIEKLKGDKTILLTTHYLDEADSLADSIAIMDQGKIIETGTSAELKRKISNSQILQVMAPNIPDGLPEILKAKGLEVKAIPEGIEIKSTHLDFYEIIDLFREKEVTLTGIQMIEPTLDDVFIHLTSRQVSA